MKVDVGNYVMDKEGKVHLITGDDMPDLTYEQIERVLTEEESPHFEFNPSGNEWSNLNKENFWDIAYKKCPLAVGKFCKWIDEYKKEIRWDLLFNGNVDIAYRTENGTGPWDAGDVTKSPKFHDIPFTMQFGIILEFLAETYDAHAFPLSGFDWTEQEEMAELIARDFMYMEVRIRNKEL